MRIPRVIALGLILAAAGQQLQAQEPRPLGTERAVEAAFGNNALQVRYLSPAPFDQIKSSLDYGVLLTEDREFVGSAALMFDTDLNVVPRLRVELGPQGYLARLAAQQKTDVFAIAFGANARYDVVPTLRISAVGSAFYSPGVLTFGSAHNLYDFTAGGEIGFTPRLTGLAGYRWFKFTLVGEPDERVQNEIFAGLRWRLE